MAVSEKLYASFFSIAVLLLKLFLFDPSEQRVHDFSKENVRRLREIQRRCKEQEAERAQSRPVPVKALWTSSKYDNVPSRVMAQLQVSNMTAKGGS